MHECSYVQKNGKNQFHGYKYATSADVLEKVNQSFVKHGIISLAKPELFDLTDVTTLKGNVEKLATIQMTITLMDVETGETFEIVGIGSGQDAGDKAVMKAETAAIKYAYMLTLNISTGDDPEADTKTDEHTLASTGSNATCQTRSNGLPIPADKVQIQREKPTSVPTAVLTSVIKWQPIPSNSSASLSACDVSTKQGKAHDYS